MESNPTDMLSKYRIGIIIQSRMGSERLPGKILKLLPDGEPVLHWVVQRCLGSKEAHTTIVATTVSPKDDEVVRFCEQHSYLCFRGSEFDVLNRYLICAEQYALDVVVRVTSDCPFIAPEVIDSCISKFRIGGFDYVNNSRTSNTFPRGLDVEVFSLEALRRVSQLATKDYQREHVTIAFYENPEMFRIGDVQADPEFYGPDLRLTVDTVEDFSFVSAVLSLLRPVSWEIGSSAIIDFLRKNPKLMLINRAVTQKPIEGRII